MNQTYPLSEPPVVAAVDGSRHALRAVLWARNEAVDRRACLRLVYVIAADADPAADEDALLILHDARSAVESAGGQVSTDCQVLRGDPATALIETSRTAQMMCLGAKGMHDSVGSRGATAAVIAESAFCPVVVVRRRSRRHPPGDRWVVAVLDDSSLATAVWQTALDEARRREASVLALTTWSSRPYGHHRAGEGLRVQLDREVAASKDDKKRPRVWAASVPEHLVGPLARTADLDQLIIVGKNNPGLIAELIGPEGRSRLRKTNCSVMIVREEQCEVLAAS